mgnify:CR=1 FL=1
MLLPILEEGADFLANLVVGGLVELLGMGLRSAIFLAEDLMSVGLLSA